MLTIGAAAQKCLGQCAWAIVVTQLMLYMVGSTCAQRPQRVALMVSTGKIKISGPVERSKVGKQGVGLSISELEQQTWQCFDGAAWQ